MPRISSAYINKILAGQTCFITGGGNGLGRALAEYCSHLGADVIIGVLHEKAAEAVARRVRSEGGSIDHVRLDVSDRADWRRVGDVIAERGRLDVLINNAGILIREPVESMGEDTIQRTFDVNVKGAFFGFQTALPFMRQAGRGRIVNVSSTGAFVGTGDGYSVYSASKAALLQLSKCLAIECAEHNILVNCVCPSAIPTGMAEDLTEEDWKEREDAALLDRTARIEDVVHSVIFLLSDQASYITGTEIVIDGGATVQSAR